MGDTQDGVTDHVSLKTSSNPLHINATPTYCTESLEGSMRPNIDIELFEL